MSSMKEAFDALMEATADTLDWFEAGPIRVAIIGPYGIVERATYTDVYEQDDHGVDQLIITTNTTVHALSLIRQRCLLDA